MRLISNGVCNGKQGASSKVFSKILLENSFSEILSWVEKISGKWNAGVCCLQWLRKETGGRARNPPGGGICRELSVGLFFGKRWRNPSLGSVRGLL